MTHLKACIRTCFSVNSFSRKYKYRFFYSHFRFRCVLLILKSFSVIIFLFASTTLPFTIFPFKLVFPSFTSHQVSSLLGDPSRLLMQKALSLRPPGLMPLGKGLLGESPTGEQNCLNISCRAKKNKLVWSLYQNGVKLRPLVLFAKQQFLFKSMNITFDSRWNQFAHHLWL